MSKNQKNKNSQKKSHAFSIKSKKTNKSVTVTKTQANKAKQAAKRALKKMPKKKRLTIAAIALIVVAALVFVFDLAVLPLEYIPVKFVKQNSFLGERELKIHFLDVGQGDSIILEFPDKTNMIIDGGDRASSVWQHILKYGEKLGIKTFDYMMLTHSDSDHVGSFSKVLDYFEVKNIFIPDIDKQYEKEVSQTYEKFIKSAENETYKDEDGNTKKANIIKTAIGDMINSQDNSNEFFVAVVSPTQSRYKELNDALEKKKATAAQKNDVSAVIYLEYLDFRSLMTGDANEVVEDEIVDKYNADFYNQDIGGDYLFSNGDKNYLINLDSLTLYKAGHHGSSGSSGEKLLNLIKPKYTVISSGRNNKYNHPHQETLTRLAAINSIVYNTQIGGDIVASVAPDAFGNAQISFTFSITGAYQTQTQTTLFAATVCVRQRFKEFL